ncbi:MAG: shikimate dehydrogenase [Erysipelotrichia bacterium]|nr:shikimate dehydrogenase [Erysipelotrichia bacterium]
MKYGLIGDPVAHSWSPQIHALLSGIEYEKIQISEENLQQFMKKRDFCGINVTIPHKQAVIQYLDGLDQAAEEIGAVNCIVNRNGKLTGYNTDCLGFRTMLEHNSIMVKNKKAAVLGSGGASKAVVQALREMGSIPVVVSRRAGEGRITYETLTEHQREYRILINATPVGMSPNCDAMPIDLSIFTELEAAVDLIANPLRTRMLIEAEKRGIRTCGGFEMLVRQAFSADELFLNQKLDPACVETCMNTLYHERRSIVLIGMPTSGKSTLGKLLAEKTGRTLVEMDDLLAAKMGMPIAQIFLEKGESYFRKEESELAESLRTGGSLAISTGGGIIKDPENMRYLSENGLVVWIDRNPELLFGSESRPLSTGEAQIRKLYLERREIYEADADIVIENNSTIEEAIQELIVKTGEKDIV